MGPRSEERGELAVTVGHVLKGFASMGPRSTAYEKIVLKSY